MNLCSLKEIHPSGEKCEFLLTEAQAALISSIFPSGVSFTLSPLVKRKATAQRAPSVTAPVSASDFQNRIPQLSPLLQSCARILSRLKAHPQAYPFLQPVDPDVLEIPDYFAVIKEPMDFSRVEEKLLVAHYTSFEEFEKDVLLIYRNAKTYNQPTHVVHVMAAELEAYSIQLFRVQRLIQSVKRRQICQYWTTMCDERQAEQRSEARCPIDEQERQTLADLISGLPRHLLWEVCRIAVPDPGDRHELLIDFAKLDTRKANLLAAFARANVPKESPGLMEANCEQVKRKESLSAYWGSPQRNEVPE